jgi:flagellar biosynthetic protein FlhB
MSTPAGERTEKPTLKRLKDARERGQVARSADLSGAIALIGITLALGWLATDVAAATADRLMAGLNGLGDLARQDVHIGTLSTLFWDDARLLARLAGPPALIAVAASLLGSVMQVGWSFSPKALHLNWSRLSPAQGFQRLSPKVSGTELAKAIVGLTAVGAIGYALIHSFYGEAPRLMAMTPAQSSAYAWDRLYQLLWQASLALALLGAGDYGIQYWRWYSQQKMTRQEVRDESRMNDGNPEIKSRVRRVQREMGRKRMLQSVKTATVVVTNPTHFAVALEYRREKMTAPVVVAKGQDELAARIRAIAREHNVPIVENVTLARALHATAEVGDVIPAPLFGAVAEVLAYLVRLKQLVL